ncbi:MAG TPA: hypothetical protein VJ779_17340 [Acetobacteraceae bacterium]|nr:hypothetical protein [Acetobacteraceae bacterium]
MTRALTALACLALLAGAAHTAHAQGKAPTATGPAPTTEAPGTTPGTSVPGMPSGTTPGPVERQAPPNQNYSAQSTQPGTMPVNPTVGGSSSTSSTETK